MFLTLIPIHMNNGEKELRGRSGVCTISGVGATTLFGFMPEDNTTEHVNPGGRVVVAISVANTVIQV